MKLKEMRSIAVELDCLAMRGYLNWDAGESKKFWELIYYWANQKTHWINRMKTFTKEDMADLSQEIAKSAWSIFLDKNFDLNRWRYSSWFSNCVKKCVTDFFNYQLNCFTDRNIKLAKYHKFPMKHISIEEHFNTRKNTELPDPSNPGRVTELNVILDFIGEYGLQKYEKRVWSYLKRGYTPKDIAEETNSPYGSVRQQVSLVRKKMLPKFREAISELS